MTTIPDTARFARSGRMMQHESILGSHFISAFIARSRAHVLLTACAALLGCSMTAHAQLGVHGETAVSFYDGQSGASPRVLNRGRATFALRADLFVDAIVSDNVAFISNMRMSQNEDPTFDFLAVRIVDVTDLGLNFQIGKFDLPFGNLGERRFTTKNAFYANPLIYEYPTALSTSAAANAKLTAPQRRAAAGMRMLDFGMYDVGAMAYGSAGMFGWALAVTDGTVSSTANRQLNTHHGFGTLVRVTATPEPGITLGAAWNHGPYLADDASAGTGPAVDAAAHAENAAEFDIELSGGHAVVYGQAVYTRWDVPFAAPAAPATMTVSTPMHAAGWYLEARYAVLPRLYVAARAGGLYFSRDGRFRGETWDDNVAEYEFGAGWRFDRAVLAKASYRITRTSGGDPADNLLATQLAVSF